jgi:hypothetical protein
MYEMFVMHCGRCGNVTLVRRDDLLEVCLENTIDGKVYCHQCSTVTVLSELCVLHRLREDKEKRVGLYGKCEYCKHKFTCLTASIHVI